MSQSSNVALLRGVERLHKEASTGDPSARNKLVEVSLRAKAGDVEALAALNTLAAVRFHNESPLDWAKAERLLNLIERKDPDALALALKIQERAKAGDKKSRRMLGMLNAHKDKNNVSAWASPNVRYRNTVGALDGASAKKFLRLTPDAEQQLIAMMLRGAGRPLSDAHTSPVTLTAAAKMKIKAAPPSAADALISNSPSFRELVKLKPPVKLGRIGTPMTEAERANLTANQGICNTARSAWDRGSPAFPSLIKQCFEIRRQNMMNGLFYADNSASNIPEFREALEAAGNVVVSKNSAMAQFRSTLPASQRRGFTMAMAVRAGKLDPKFVEFAKPGLAVDPELLKGFLDGLAMA